MLAMLHADAAGLNIGAEEIFVAVPAERTPEPVRSFGSFTRDLHELADWLQECRVRTVAMESTGVYWIPLYQILETCGFQVFLVNTQHVKNVPGRKSDVSDCQWIQFKTHSLLRECSHRCLPHHQIAEHINCSVTVHKTYFYARSISSAARFADSNAASWPQFI